MTCQGTTARPGENVKAKTIETEYEGVEGTVGII